MKLNEYGKGRLSVLNEVSQWLTNEIEELKALPKNEDSHINATISGQIKAYIRIRQRLHTKRERLKEF